MIDEIWRDIPGYEGLYQVSDLGRVRSLDRIINRLSRYGVRVDQPLRGRVLKTVLGRNHHNVALHVGDRQVTTTVHILVAMAFIPEWEKGVHVHHKDGNGTNNVLSNLTCMKPGDHSRHHMSGEGAPKAKLSEREVQEIRSLLHEGVRQTDVARKFGVHKTTIRDIKQGSTWTHLPRFPTRMEAINATRRGRPPSLEGRVGRGREEGESGVQP